MREAHIGQTVRMHVRDGASADDAAPLKDASLLSFNQATAERASLPDVIDACARHGVPGISIWRHKLTETGLERELVGGGR